LELTRRYSTGAELSFWYAKTDTSRFHDFNRGYSEKGIALAIPVNMFFDHDAKGHHTYATCPWSRDVGQVVYRPSLYHIIRDFLPLKVKRYLKRMKE